MITECVICGGEADGIDHGRPDKESQPICWKCRREVYRLKREANRQEKVNQFNVVYNGNIA